MSLLASLPETGSLFLMGTFLILSGLVLRRIFHLGGKGIATISKGNESSGQNPLKLDHEEAMSHPGSTQL
jgi:hypothetical protein